MECQEGEKQNKTTTTKQTNKHVCQSCEQTGHYRFWFNLQLMRNSETVYEMEGISDVDRPEFKFSVLHNL